MRVKGLLYLGTRPLKKTSGELSSLLPAPPGLTLSGEVESFHTWQSGKEDRVHPSPLSVTLTERGLEILGTALFEE